MSNNNTENNTVQVGNELEIRRQKLADLIAAGKNPYEITHFEPTHYSTEVIADVESLEGKQVVVAGRLISKRIMGKASFAHMLDKRGSLQLYLQRDTMGEEAYAEFKKLDTGDIVGAVGEVFKTKTGEVSVRVSVLTLLCKALQPLPEKFHGLSDPEIRYRKRYLDLIANPEVRDTFVKRSRIISTIREVLDDRDFLEVETPVLQTEAGGASARPFVTHHNALDTDMYLRIATELHLKRLVVGGFDRVYEIGRIFRNEGMDIKHNPEFTSIEIYQAYADYHDMMKLTEDLFTVSCMRVNNTLKINYQGTDLDLTPPWRRLTMVDAVKEYAGIDVMGYATDEEAIAAVKALGIEVEGQPTRGKLLDLVFEEKVEEQLIQPTFIMDYPIEVSPLTKRIPENPGFTYRFEVFITGREYGNAYSELNDPIDQYERFVQQLEQREAGDEEAHVMDNDFVNALEVGMPPTGGLGIGIDRMVMLLTDSRSIRDVLLFPTMRVQ